MKDQGRLQAAIGKEHTTVKLRQASTVFSLLIHDHLLLL